LLGRVRVANKFPDVKAPIQPSDSLPPSAAAPVPLTNGLPRGRRLFCRMSRRPARAPAYAPVSEMDNRLSARPESPKERQGLPGYGAVLFVRAVVQHPAGLNPALPLLLFEKIYGKVAIAFAKNRTLGIRNDIAFEATYPRPTRSRAYASPASLPRPSPGSLPARTGSPLAGRISHPLDDGRNFMESSHLLQSQSTSRAWSHCMPYPRAAQRCAQ
jgi:hypothetical protein